MSRTASFLLVGVITALLASQASAQMAGPDEDALRERYESKLTESWITSNPWTADYDEAREKAKESGKVIFAYFTRSYSP